MKAWITVYALTTGIIEVTDGEISKNFSSVLSAKSLGYHASFHGEGKEWHLSKESAIRRAEEMRIAKLKSLDKQIKKISAIDFEDESKYQRQISK